MDLQAKLAELAELQRQRDDIDGKMKALFRPDPKAEGEKRRGRPPKPKETPPK